MLNSNKTNTVLTMNKDSNLTDVKNKVFTPKEVQQALEYLPHNYVLLAFNKLKAWKEGGKIEKSFSKRYIIKVFKQESNAFNKDILDALVEVGNENFKTLNHFGRITKKASTEN